MPAVLLARLSSPRVQLGFVLGLVLLLLVVGWKYHLKVNAQRSAFCRWRNQILELQQGTDLSARFNYPNPPIMAVLLEPLARLPLREGALTWFAVKILCAGLSVWLLLRLASPVWPGWAWMLVVLAGLPPLVGDLTHGNVNLFVLLVLSGALALFVRGRDSLAGVLLGLAIACKLTPLLFVPYFAWKRCWRVLGGVVLGLVLFLYPGVVPSLRLGWEHNQRQLVSWYGVLVEPYLVDGKVTSEHDNQSLPGLLTRQLSRQPSFEVWDWEQSRMVPLRFDNWLELSALHIKRLTQIGLVLFVLLVVMVCRSCTQPEQRAGPWLAAEFAIILLGMLLFSERTWKHHAVTLVLPLAVVVGQLAGGRLSLWRQRSLAILLGVVMVLITLPSLGSAGSGARQGLQLGLGDLAMVYGAFTWAFVLLLVGQVLVLTARPVEGRGGLSHEDVREPSRSVPG
jgi:alpha-1,2-mannosyltransferase